MTNDSDASSLQTLHTLSRQRLEEEFGLRMTVDAGDPFFNALFYGTLMTFVERVDSSGFCQTSFGEENNVRCYGRVHYPRDADSVARVLATVGLIEPAIRILEFTLDHVPQGQYYIPHIYGHDGTIKANTVQIDTPAHTILALARCIDLCGPTERLGRLYRVLSQIVDGCWAQHFHDEVGLLDAGNYNEQLDTHAVTCDLFTNSAMYAGLRQLAVIAEAFGEPRKAHLARDRAQQLAEGIERRLYDPAQGLYLLRTDLGSGSAGGEFKWINLYAERWYPGRAEAWSRALERLRETTSIDWCPFRVISGYPTRDSILGKAFGHMLGFMARSGRFEMLSHHLCFARSTIRRPRNVYPEAWLYRRNPEPGDYEQGFWRRFAGVWESFSDSPDGDYTMDSGNAEQSAAFLQHFIDDLLGVSVTETDVELCPRLPFKFSTVEVAHAPVRLAGSEPATVGYRLTRQSDQATLEVQRSGTSAVTAIVPIPADARSVTLTVNGVAQTSTDYGRCGELCLPGAKLSAEHPRSADTISCAFVRDQI